MGDRPDPAYGNRLTAAINYPIAPLSVGSYEREGYKVLGRLECDAPGHTLNDEEARRLALTDSLDPTSRLGVSGDAEIRDRSQRSVNKPSAVNYETEIIFRFKPIKLH